MVKLQIVASWGLLAMYMLIGIGTLFAFVWLASHGFLNGL